MGATLGNFDSPSLMAKEIYNLEYRITELEDALSAAEVERDNALLALRKITDAAQSFLNDFIVRSETDSQNTDILQQALSDLEG